MSARIRTGYSFRNAVGHLPEVIARIQECGWKHAPITDTASTFGWVKWKKLCLKNDLIPVFGVELGVSPNRNAKKPSVDRWTFIAKDQLRPVSELVALATQQFRYEPLLSVEQALGAKDVFKIIGHRSQLEGIPPGTDDLFFALAPSTARGQYRQAQELGFRMIACSDNRFTQEGDLAFYEVLCGRNASTQSYPQHILTDAEWKEVTQWARDGHREALSNRERVFSGSTATFAPATLLRPKRPASLKTLCERGARKLGCDLKRPEYAARLKKELDLIKEKKFEDYFYIISDVCKWARERMIVGPARGSSCGSLVCYLLEITTVDPIPYGLIFERFIDINRDDLPDIDIDFSDQKRQMVFDYMAQKYGAERVARLGTVAMYQPRSSLNEVRAALDVPPWKVNPVLDSIIERSSGDSRALQATEDTLKDTEAGRELLAEFPEMMIATRMEGHPRHFSQHAAGIVLTETPVIDYVTVDSRTGATHCDKKDAEELNLLKIDALGLTQLSIFEDALELAGLPMHHLETIPLDDQASFDVLNKRHWSGIFQFNGLALQSIASQIHYQHIEDIISTTALGRPGPLNTGGTHRWIKIKNGEKPTYPHPLFEPYLQNTLGVVAYQEQVMEIGRNIGNLSWADVTALRKAMSKSLGKEFFDQYGDRWKAGAREKGIPEEVLEKVWDDLCAYGSWAFNRSHAVAYGLVSYYCCWLKAHYPLEFAAATLSHTDSVETQIKLLRELHSEGTEYVPADKELSRDKWTIGFKDNRKVLVGPLSTVKGIGPKLTQQIMSARSRNEPLPARADKLLSNPVTDIDSIFPITDRFKQIMPDPRERNIHTTPTKIVDAICDPFEGEYEVLVFCVVEHIKPKDENEPINVARRGYKVKGPSQALNLRLKDDTDVIFAKVDRWNYERFGARIVERGRPGKAMYAIKGTVPPDFRMIRIRQVRYIGDMELETGEDAAPVKEAAE